MRVDWRYYRITVKPYWVSRRVRRVLQLGGTGGAGGGGSGGSAVIDLGNERDATDYVLRPHGHERSRTSASANVDGGGGGGYKTVASEVWSTAKVEVKDVISLAEDYVAEQSRQKRTVSHEFVKKSKSEIVAQRASHAIKE